MHRLDVGWIELAMRDAGSRRHPLKLARPQHFPVSHRVAMFQRPLQNVSNDFHVPMRMRSEALSGLDEVLVHHPQRAKSRMTAVLVMTERERVKRVQPAMVK